MATTDSTGFMRTACHECDLLITIDELPEGARAACPRCGHVLAVGIDDGMTRSLALAISAALLLVASNLFPFLSLQTAGIEQVMTLPRSAWALYQDGYWTVALLVTGPIIGIPALMLAAAIALLVPLRQDRGTPWMIPAGRLLFALNPWSMVEVFVIGVLVSLVKIGTMATVVLGLSFWSYVVFALCFIATFTNLDRMSMWRRIESLQREVESLQRQAESLQPEAESLQRQAESLQPEAKNLQPESHSLQPRIEGLQP
jgi:paraquat-inducible protein A